MISPGPEDWRALRTMVSGRAVVHEEISDGVLQAARQGGVLPLLSSLQPALVERLREELERGIVVQMHIEQAERHVAEVLRAAGIERAMLIKGNATRRLLYEAPEQRPGRDVDILVSADEFRPALRALKESGWEDAVLLPTVRAGGEDPYAWTFRRAFGEVSLECDVHQRLTLVPGYTLNLDRMLDQAQAHDNAPLPLALPEDLFLGGVLHMGKTGLDGPLKSWVDLLRLAGHPDVDLGRCAERARTANMAAVTWACLRMLDRWFSLRSDPEILQVLKPSPMAVAALESMIGGKGPMARRWPRSRRMAYLLPGLFLQDGPIAATAWSGWRIASLIRARVGTQVTMPGT